MSRRLRIGALGLIAVALASWTTASVQGQAGAPKGEWRTYGGDLGHTRYAPLDQITAGNFSKLEVAWRFKTDNLGPRLEFNLQSTPLMVGGRLYSTGGTRRAVVSLDAATGELLWVHSEDEGARGAAAPRQLSGRGLAYWTRRQRGTHPLRDAGLSPRRPRRQDREPRRRRSARDGILDLKADLDRSIDLTTGSVGLHATPIVAGDIVLVGAAFETGANPKSKSNIKGAVRAFDVRTGKRLWMFKTIPEPGEVGAETWEDDSWAYTGNTGVWAQISVDLELGMAYLPVEMPTHDYYGGTRPGDRPVCRDSRRRRSEDRRAQVALPAGASRHLGHGHPVCADPGRHHGQRPDDQGGRTANQAGVPVCVRPRDRSADLADRGASGPAGRRAGRAVFEDAAVPHASPPPTTGRGWPSTI